jgi:hypothetical protein
VIHSVDGKASKQSGPSLRKLLDNADKTPVSSFPSRSILSQPLILSSI